MKTLGIVPARSGSRRLPGKNLATINGKSLVRIATECGLESLDHVIVSTDSEDIWLSASSDRAADIENGRLSWHQRPSPLARDDTISMQVVHEVARITNQPWDVVLLLQPTSPLRLPDDVRAVLHIMRDADAVISLREDDDIRRGGLFRVGHANRLRAAALLPGMHAKANGAVYAMTRKALGEFHDWEDHLPDLSYGYLMPASRSIDVDTADDLTAARAYAAGLAEVA